MNNNFSRLRRERRKNMNYFVIFSPHIAVTLQRHGFKIIKREKNHKDPTKEVYLFENTFEFQTFLQELLNK